MTKIKSLKNLVGTELTDGNFDGALGISLQEKYRENGVTINEGKGVDILQTGQEIKSRRKSSSSDVTIGSYNINDLISTSGEVVLEKMNSWRYHEINHNNEVINEVNINWNLIKDDIQNDLNSLIKNLNDVDLDTHPTRRLGCSDYFSAEKTDSKNSVKIRIKSSQFHRVKGKALSAKNFKTFFEEL